MTLAGEGGEVVGHASFLDHPIGGLVDPAHWEPYMQQHFQAGTLTVGGSQPDESVASWRMQLPANRVALSPPLQPLNTLFLHLFVAQPGFAPDSVREILR